MLFQGPTTGKDIQLRILLVRQLGPLGNTVYSSVDVSSDEETVSLRTHSEKWREYTAPLIRVCGDGHFHLLRRANTELGQNTSQSTLINRHPGQAT